MLIPGWSGGLEPDELAYVQERLKALPEIRRLWGFTVSRITEAGLLRVAEWGKPGDPSHNRRLVVLNPKRRGIRAGDPLTILRAALPGGMIAKEDLGPCIYDWETDLAVAKEFWDSLRRGADNPVSAEGGPQGHSEPDDGKTTPSAYLGKGTCVDATPPPEVNTTLTMF